MARARDAGVERIISLGTDIESSREAIVLAEQYPQVFAAVGIHPESVHKSSLDDLQTIRELASHPRVIAIGEIGLDYCWDKGSADLQQQFLERQLELAAELDLPVCLHDRESHQEIIGTLKKHSSSRQRGVLHAFSGDRAMALEAIDSGFFLSLAGPITFRNERKAAEVIPSLPPDRILIETDSPYLSPHPLRGRRNEPANVALVAGRIAELLNRTVVEIAAQTTENARALFGL